MIVTEEFAKTKICHKTLGQPRGNTDTCMGRQCMAWQWATQDKTGYCGLAGIPVGRLAAYASESDDPGLPHYRQV